MIDKVLSEHFINGKQISIVVITDNHSKIELAERLWYDVYIKEFEYKITDGVDPISQRYGIHRNGSLIFMAITDNQCIATLRATHNSTTSLEFDYKEITGESDAFEISKLITKVGFRQGDLTKILMIQTHFYCREIYRYHYILMNTASNLVSYYLRMGFNKVIDKEIIHPVIKNESYLMFCTFEKFNEFCNRSAEFLKTKNITIKTTQP